MRAASIRRKRQNHKSHLENRLKEIIRSLTLHCLAQHIYATQCRNFDLNIRRDHQKISHEHPDYKSVDEKNLSNAMFQKTTTKRIRK